MLYILFYRKLYSKFIVFVNHLYPKNMHTLNLLCIKLSINFQGFVNGIVCDLPEWISHWRNDEFLQVRFGNSNFFVSRFHADYAEWYQLNVSSRTYVSSHNTVGIGSTSCAQLWYRHKCYLTTSCFFNKLTDNRVYMSVHFILWRRRLSNYNWYFISTEQSILGNF